MDFQEKQKEENFSKPIPSYRFQSDERGVKTRFCRFMNKYGASFYTMRDRLMYETTTIKPWESEGVRGMMRRFNGYEGDPSKFFDGLSRSEKSRFVCMMEKEGGMSRSTCYHRFLVFNFKPWEVEGLREMEKEFFEMKSEEFTKSPSH